MSTVRTIAVTIEGPNVEEVLPDVADTIREDLTVEGYKVVITIVGKPVLYTMKQWARHEGLTLEEVTEPGVYGILVESDGTTYKWMDTGELIECD